MRRILLTLRAAVGVVITSLTYFVFIAVSIPVCTARSSPVARISLLLVTGDLRLVERLVVLRGLELRLAVVLRLVERRVVLRGLAERLDELRLPVVLRVVLRRPEDLRVGSKVETNFFVKERAIAALQSIVY